MGGAVSAVSTAVKAVSKIEKIKPKTFEVTDCESNQQDYREYPLSFESWSDVNFFILQKSMTLKDRKGYLKCFFKVVFEDGFIYTGRYDIENRFSENANLKNHIYRFVEYCSKDDLDPAMQEEARHIMNTYDIKN